MRVYIAVTAEQLSKLLVGPIAVEDYLTPAQFEFDPEVDEEHREHLISLLAAEDAIELNQGSFGLVVAADFDDSQLLEDRPEIAFSQVAALLYSDDAESLSWFAPDEIQFQIGTWLK